MDMYHLTNRKNAKQPVSAAPDTAFLQKKFEEKRAAAARQYVKTEPG